MAGFLSDQVLDFGFDTLGNGATHIVLYQLEPPAISGTALGARRGD